MANTDKNLIITPNIGSTTADPKIVFSGADASTTAQNISLNVYPTNSGTLSFEGSAGQLFSITNSLSGSIYSVNDVSGIPSIEVLDTGLIKLGQYGGNVLIGTATDSGHKLRVDGTTRFFPYPSSGVRWIDTFNNPMTNWNGVTSMQNTWGLAWRYNDSSSTRAMIAYDHYGSEEFQIASGYGPIVFNVDLSQGHLDSPNEGTEVLRLTSFATAPTSMRSPIFYDSDDTSYYANMNAGTALRYLRVNGDWGASPFGSGHETFTITGTYASFVQRATNGNLGYWLHHISDGIYWLYGGRGATNGSDWDWSLKAYPNQDGSRVEIRTDLRVPFIYDLNDTNYYVDPNNTTYLNNLIVNSTAGNLPSINRMTRSGAGITTENLILYLDYSDLNCSTNLKNLAGISYSISSVNITFTYKDGIGTAYSNNSNNRVVVSGITLGTTMTYEAWLNADAFSGWDTVFDNGAERPLLGFSNGSMSSYPDQSNLGPVLSANTWYHCVWVFSGGTVSHYVDGILRAGPSAYAAGNLGNSSVLWIGGDGSAESFYGHIAISRVYNKALNAAEVLRNYSVERDRFYNNQYISPVGAATFYKLGLGNITPDVQLSVSGDSHISGTLHLGGNAGSVSSWGSRDYTSSGNRYFNANTYEFNNYGYGSTWNFYLNSSEARHTVSVRAPIFYDSNDTGYYLDPNGTSNLVRLSSQTMGRHALNIHYTDRYAITSDTNYYVGSSGWAGSHTWDNAFNLLGSGFIDLWTSSSTHPSGSTAYVHAQGLQILHMRDGGATSYGWQMVGAHDAANRWWLRGKWGSTYRPWYEITTYGNNVGGNLYASIYYDADNSAYYCDPNGNSQFYGLNIRGDVNSTGVNNQLCFWGGGGATTTSAIGFKASGGVFTNPTGNGDGYNTYLTMDTDGRGWVFRRGASDFSAAYTSGWILNNGVWQANASMRAPIFYDSNDLNYYLDPDGWSRLNKLRLNGPTYSEWSVYSNTTNNLARAWAGTLVIGSDSSTTENYTIIETTVPQDSYMMGGFTIELFENYDSTNSKTTITLSGYWNPESNGGFQGWMYTSSNPNLTPNIQIGRNTAGKTVFVIAHWAGSYNIIMAKDLWLGYSGGSNEYGYGWTMRQAAGITDIINLDTVIPRTISSGFTRNIVRASAGCGYLDGNYSSSETTATSGAIYTIGGSYQPSVSSTGNMYGIGYTYANVSGIGGYAGAYTSGTAWGLYVASNGAARVFLDADSGRVISTGDMRSGIYYDLDTNYYLDPASTSYLYTVGSFYLKNNYDVSTDHPYGIYFATGLSTSYAIYRESGAWSHPYPDLRIAFHTGIKIGAHYSYGGTRFYDNSDMVTELFSVGNGDANVRVTNNLDVGSNIGGKLDVYAGGSSGVNWSSGFNLGDASNYTSWIQDAGVSRFRNLGTGGHDWYSSTAGTRTMFLDNSGNVTFAGNVTANSDKRLKTNILLLENSLNKVRKLRGVSFDWIESGKHSIGVIAQEIEEILPEVVLTTQERKPGETQSREIKAVDYGKIVPVLIEAIKEQDNKIQLLETRLEELINKIT